MAQKLNITKHPACPPVGRRRKVDRGFTRRTRPGDIDYKDVETAASANL